MTRKAIILSLSIAILLCIASCGFTNSKTAGAIPQLVIPTQKKQTTVKAAIGNISKTMKISGKVTSAAIKNMSLGNTEGYLARIYVKAGDMVKKGDVLAELNTDDIKYRIKEQEISVQLAQVRLDEAQSENSPQQQYSVREAQLNLERENLELDKLKENLNNSTLMSTIAGIVTFTDDANINKHIEPFHTLVTVADKTKFMVECTTAQNNIKIGTGVEILADNLKTHGKILSNNSSEKGGTITASFNNPPNTLHLDEPVFIQYTEASVQDVLVLPSNAINHDVNAHSFVRLVKDGNIIEKYIETGIFDNFSTQIISGLSVGDEVISNN